MSSLVFFKALLKFHGTSQLFKYLKKRYTKDQVKLLNSLVRLKGKIRTKRNLVNHHRSCLSNRVLPNYLQHRLTAAKVKSSLNIERAFLTDEIQSLLSQISWCKAKFANVWKETRKFSSIHDLIRISLYINSIDERMNMKELRHHSKQLEHLICKRYGTTYRNGEGHVHNLSDYSLDENEKFVLEHGLNFKIPPTRIKTEEVLAEFELLFSQLHLHHRPTNEEDFTRLKANLCSTAYDYCNVLNKSATLTSTFNREHYKSLRLLRNNHDLIIIRPDKGSGTVILNKSDYISKMNDVLKDTTKFTKIGPAEMNDRTPRIESDFQKYLKKMKDKELLSSEIADVIRPVGSQRPRMYGLPKIHKENVPMRPILCTIGAPQHSVAVYLKGLLKPVHDKFSNHCTKDSFSFVEYIKSQKCTSTAFLCSFDVKSLFTSIPVVEVIKICAESLYDDKEIETPVFAKDIFIKLMEFATSHIEFSFDGMMYRQENGLGMGNVLSSILSDIFVGFYENKLMERNLNCSPRIYKRYVDDCFASFNDVSQCLKFRDELNAMHPSLQFTIEMEENNTLPFLDILISKVNNTFCTTIYRKKTFTGLYQRWDSFCPLSTKLNLIDMLVHRAVKICSKSKLNGEIENIKKILLNNGYPLDVIERNIKKKIEKLKCLPTFGPKKCPVYLKLPYLGEFSEKTSKVVRSNVCQVYNSVQLRSVFSTRSSFPASHKDVLPILTKNNVIYQFKCKSCESTYIGRTSKRLENRITEHVPASIRNQLTTPILPVPKKKSSYNLRKKCQTEDNQIFTIPSYVKSAIGLHLLENPCCANDYSIDSFSILARARKGFHLNVLEAIYINKSKPILCRQKQYVYNTKLFPFSSK